MRKALKAATDDMALLRSCLLGAEELVVSNAQEFRFPRASWLAAVAAADNVEKMLTAVRGYESPLVGGAFDWDKAG